MRCSFVRGLAAGAVGLLAIVATARGADDGWIDLVGAAGLDAWKPPTVDWARASAVRVDPSNPKKLAYEAGPGPILINGPIGRTRDIVTGRSFGDLEAHFEFLIPKGSNSGVKLMGLYEIQISDSFGVAKPGGADSGGIYPRAELLPRYRHIDEGHPPTVNAARPPGDWQTLDVVFKAPRFDASGAKVANARVVVAVLNGRVVQSDVELATPTGHAYRLKEVAAGPILLQADHGPVAFRNIRARPLPATGG